MLLCNLLSRPQGWDVTPAKALQAAPGTAGNGPGSAGVTRWVDVATTSAWNPSPAGTVAEAEICSCMQA